MIAPEMMAIDHPRRFVISRIDGGPPGDRLPSFPDCKELGIEKLESLPETSTLRMELIEIGKVARPHGFRGALIAVCPSGQDAVLANLTFLLLGSNKTNLRKFDISEAAWMPKGWKIKLTGIETDAQVKALVGSQLFAERGALPPPSLNEYYVADLVGAPVLDAKTEETLGSLEGVEAVVAGQDRWWIKTLGDSIAIPATQHFIKKVGNDEKTGKITIWIQNLGELA